MDRYKSYWLGRELRVPASKYLNLVRSLSEVRELNAKSKQAELYLGDRMFSGFFSIKPLLKISLIPLFLGSSSCASLLIFDVQELRGILLLMLEVCWVGLFLLWL